MHNQNTNNKLLTNKNNKTKQNNLVAAGQVSHRTCLFLLDSLISMLVWLLLAAQPANS